jgi:hypothetical protein
MHLIDVYDSSITYFSLSSFIRYFKRELLPLGAIEETHMPQYLSSWTNKNSPQCMYTVYLVRLWSIAHLRACCWYIDCGKAFCPVEEEDAKKACDEADSQGAALGANQGEVQDDEVEVDINKLPKKEKIKVLNQRKRDVDRAKEKADREALRAKVGDQGSQRQWLPPLLHLCCHRFPLHHSHRIPASGIPPVHSYHCQDFSRSHRRPSWTLQGEVCMYMSSSSLDPFCPLMHTMCNTRPSPRNGWI